jgi:hypothetical protein
MQLKHLKRLHYLFSIEFPMKNEIFEIRELLFEYINEKRLKFYLKDESDFTSKSEFQKESKKWDEESELVNTIDKEFYKDSLLNRKWGIKHKYHYAKEFFKMLTDELKIDYQYVATHYIDNEECLEACIEPNEFNFTDHELDVVLNDLETRPHAIEQIKKWRLQEQTNQQKYIQYYNERQKKYKEYTENMKEDAKKAKLLAILDQD